LPTRTPESAGLCAWGAGFIVWRSLETAIGFGSPDWLGAEVHRFSGPFRVLDYGGHAQGSFGGAGS